MAKCSHADRNCFGGNIFNPYLRRLVMKRSNSNIDSTETVLPHPQLFSVLYGDCPWRYNFARHKKNGGCTYPTMSTKELCDLPVAEITAPNAILFQWAPGPKMKDAIKVMEAWGFTHKTKGFTWIKLNRKNGQLYSGLGSYTCGNTEDCIIGVKGKSLRRINRSVKQIIVAPIGKHSAKPPQARWRIEQMYGDVPRIELFARQTAPGWVSLGNEIDGQDIRDALSQIIRSNQEIVESTTKPERRRTA